LIAESHQWHNGARPDVAQPPDYINYMALPVRHGMTIGELATYFNAENHLHARSRWCGWKTGIARVV